MTTNQIAPGTPEALNALLTQIRQDTAPDPADPAAAAQRDEDEAAAQGQAGDHDAQRWYEQTAAAYRAAGLTPAQARALGREHGAAVPCIPADPEQARSDRNACRALRGASPAALDAYLEGHLQGQGACSRCS